jgi:hypothetical protein
VHSQAGKKVLEKVKTYLFLECVNIDEAIKFNPSMVKSVAVNKNRELFFKGIDSQCNIEKIINSYVDNCYSLRKRISIWLRTFIKQHLK